MSNERIDDKFDEEFGDLLSGVTSKKEPVVEPAVTVNPATTGTPSNVGEVKAEPKEKSEDGFVPFGTTIASVPIPRFKATKETKSRFALLSKQVQAIKLHFVEGIGTFLCLDDKCCEYEGFPRTRYLIPIVQYTVNKNGAIIGNEIELKALSLGAETYQALVDAIQFSGREIQDVDIICTCSDEQYQKLTFAADASQGAQWKTFPGAKAIVEKYKANKQNLYRAVARKITLDVYLSKKGVIQPNNPQPTIGVEKLEDLLED